MTRINNGVEGVSLCRDPQKDGKAPFSIFLGRLIDEGRKKARFEQKNSKNAFERKITKKNNKKFYLLNCCKSVG